MAQHDYNLANAAGATFRGDLNDALAAAVSQNSGTAEPSTKFAYMLWADTTNGLLKIRNAANSGWVTIGTLAAANLGLLSLAGGTLTGALNHAPEVDVASASTCDIGAAGANSIRITGTTTITSLGTAASGVTRWGRFAGILTLTHNGTSLFLNNGGSNIVTAANDFWFARSYGSGNWAMTVIRANGTALQATGGAWTPLYSQSASSSSTVDFSNYLTSTYDTYWLKAEKVIPSTTMNIGIRLGYGAPPTYVSASYVSAMRTIDTANTTNGEFAPGGAGTFDLSGGSDFIASQPCSFDFELDNANGSSVRKSAEWKGKVVTGSSSLKKFHGAGVAADSNLITSPITSIRVVPSSGNIVSGVFTLYGLKRS